MANIDMKTLTIGDNTYIIIDAGARTLIGDLSDLDTEDQSSLVAAINEVFHSGGGGTSDYTDLTNKPQINGNTLSGNKTAAQLGLATDTDASNKLPLAGGSMTGNIAMGLHKITGLAPGTSANDAVSKTQMETAITNLGEVLDFKGAVQTVADLPATGNTGGDVYFVRSLGAMFVWVETGVGGAYEWDEMGEHYDMSGYLEAPTGATANQVIAFDGNDWVAKTLVPEVSDSSTGAVTIALDPEKIYKLTGALTSLTVTLNSPSSGQHAHYHIAFDSGSTAVSLTLPQTVTMPSGFQVEANKHYEIDILDGYGAAQSW